MRQRSPPAPQPAARCILDASAVVAFLMEEAGGDLVESRLHAGGCLIHSVNLCEVLCYLRRLGSYDEAGHQVTDFLSLGPIMRTDFDVPFLQIIADYKTAPGPVSLADCFGLALAQRESLPFVTSDRHELTRVAARGIVTIDFIR